MNSKQYYKTGAYVVGLVCCSLILLITFSFERKPAIIDHSKLTIIQELRLYRQLLSDVKSSNNPNFSEELKVTCGNELDDVNAMIDSFEAGTHDEISMRTQIESLTQRLLADPYISSTGRGIRPLVNAKIDM